MGAGVKTFRILHVDDDPLMHDVVELALGFESEFVVMSCGSGEEALAAGPGWAPDLIILDVMMPDMDGPAVLALARSRQQAARSGRGHRQHRPGDGRALRKPRHVLWAQGPDFWNSVEGALAEIYPDLAIKIGALDSQAIDADVPQQPRVLVVDDDPDIETFLASRLGKFGIDTLYAPDAVQGFRAACRDEPTVIITDNYMPDGDAQYLLYRLRSSSLTANIPVFVISARKLSELTEQTLRRSIGGRPGAAQISTKSFDTDELFNALKKFSGFDKHHA